MPRERVTPALRRMVPMLPFCSVLVFSVLIPWQGSDTAPLLFGSVGRQLSPAELTQVGELAQQAGSQPWLILGFPSILQGRDAILVYLQTLRVTPAMDAGTADRPSMASLRASFRRASRPQPSELVRGTWVEITNIATEQFVTGRSRPEHMLFDMEGIKRPELPKRPYDWTLRFSAAQSAVVVTFESAWTPAGNRPDTATTHFDAAGDLVFEKDYGGDGRWIYRCRAASAQRLVCLLQNHETGHGVEFLRIDAGGM
jgi:hypothetical protein